MSGHRVLPRLNDIFIIQSIPPGDDSLNRARWFIMGVIAQSFSPKFTTWLPTQHIETHVHGQTQQDKKRAISCHNEGNTRRRGETTKQQQHIETKTTATHNHNKRLQTQEVNDEVIGGRDALLSRQPIPGTISWS